MKHVLKTFIMVLGLLLLFSGTEIVESLRIGPIDNNTNFWSGTVAFNPIYSIRTHFIQSYSLNQLSGTENALNISVSSFGTNYNLNTSLIQPYDLTGDSSNNIWFTDYSQHSIYKLNPSLGTYTNYSLPSDINPFTIIYGGNNVLWLTDFNFIDNASQVRNIVRYNITSENITVYKIPTLDPGPFGIIIQNNNTLWFTEWYGKKIARLDLLPNPTITEFNAKCTNINWCGPLGIASDSQGNIWYVDTYSATFIKFNPENKQQTAYPIPNEFLSPVALKFDSSGDIWTGEHAGYRILRFDPINNTFVFYAVPYLGSYALGLNDLGFDAKGNIWFDEHFTNRLGRLDPISGTVMQYVLPQQEPLIQKIYVSKMDNKIWYAEWGTNSIGMLDESKAPLLTVSSNTSNIFDSSGSNKQITVDVKVQLDSPKPLFITSLTQNSTDIQVLAPTFNITMSQNQTYSFPVKISITNKINVGTYYIPIGVQGSNYTATTTVILQITQNQSINGFSFIYIVSILLPSALIERKRRKK